MRLIDADKLKFPNIAIFDMKLHGVTVPMVRLIDLQMHMPTVDAVPLDKLCEWLTSIPMMNCRVCKESIGFCTSKEAADNCCGSKERWKAILTMLMEGLDGIESMVQKT